MPKDLPYAVVDVSTSFVIERFQKKEDAEEKATENPRFFLVVHKSHLKGLGAQESE